MVGYPGVAINEAKRPKLKEGGKELDCSGMYLLPGFVDMHTHSDFTLIADGHTTFDTPALPASQIIAHHNHTLASGHFAEVAKAAEIGF